MRLVRWLHISDLHMREVENAQRKAVLSAMLEDIRQRNLAGMRIDFVVVTGDLAFSGKSSEYKLVVNFLDELATLLTLKPENIFCVPGNHDVQREQSKMCFRGTRFELNSEADVYKFLADNDEKQQLLRRLENYYKFEESFLVYQDREPTDEALGYVSKIDLDDLRIAILGLNSSWLSEGGVGDEGKLLIGEGQIASAIDIARRYDPHVIMSLQHHPFDMLQRFHRRTVQRRLNEACNFIHYGHLHDPDVTEIVTGNRNCITIAAGASFESRVFRNTFTIVELAPISGKVEVTFVEYNPQNGLYEYETKKTFDHPLDGSSNCSVEELAEAISSYSNEAHTLSGYLSSLLLGVSSDVPFKSMDTVAFGNWDTVKAASDSQFSAAAERFLGVSHAIRLLCGRKPLSEILTEYGHPIRSFACKLTELAEQEPVVNSYLQTQDVVRSPRRSTISDRHPLRHTVALLSELMDAGDWEGAQSLAERSIHDSAGVAKFQIMRALAHCLARSTEEREQARAAKLYGELAASDQAEPADWAALATLRMTLRCHDDAKAAIRSGINQFPDRSPAFIEIGLRIVQECGDRDFRNWLLSQGKGHHSG